MLIKLIKRVRDRSENPGFAIGGTELQRIARSNGGFLPKQPLGTPNSKSSRFFIYHLGPLNGGD